MKHTDETMFLKKLNDKELQLLEGMLAAKYEKGYEDGYQAALSDTDRKKAD